MAKRNYNSKEEIREMVISSGLNLIKNSEFSAFVEILTDSLIENYLRVLEK